jgi:hypothetical protein
MANPQRFCIFCGAAGLTKEHIWADWSAEYIPKNVRGHGKQELRIDFDEKAKETVAFRNLKPIDGDPRSRKSKCVCKQCNEGWMSRIQEKVKPIALKMILGNSVILGVAEQRLISSWITMATMASDAQNPKMSAIPESHTKWFNTWRSPPYGWKIFVGSYPRGMTDPWWDNESGLLLDLETPLTDDMNPANVQTSTYTFGKLYVSAFSADTGFPGSVRDEFFKARRFTARGSVYLRQIWPIIANEIRWPPAIMTIGDARSGFGHLLNTTRQMNARTAREKLTQQD